MKTFAIFSLTLVILSELPGSFRKRRSHRRLEWRDSEVKSAKA